VEDVRQFSQLSGDRGVHHVQPDTGGRVMVQGLLTATLPTKIGGDLNFIARDMTFEFLRPVFTGETITTDVTFTRCRSRKVGCGLQWRPCAPTRPARRSCWHISGASSPTQREAALAKRTASSRGSGTLSPRRGKRWGLGWSRAEGRSRNSTNLVTGIGHATASAREGSDDYASNQRG
jgi:hypothetical protein